MKIPTPAGLKGPLRRRMKMLRGGTSLLTHHRGITIVELMIVISIIGIVSTVAVWTASNSINKAKEAQLKTMARTLVDDVHTYINSHDSYHRFVSEQDDTYLNHKLESLWESEPYGNIFGHRNPYSKSPVVLNWGSIPASLKYPALFITSSNTYSYDEISQATAEDDLRGTVIVWMKNGESQVHIFYIDVEGKKSRLRFYAE
jgi:prepilin-type N-terminal cleavage/methylation domain-containing protein